jgi:hypothetical protein
MLLIAFVYAVTPEEVLIGYGPLGIAALALSFIGYKMFNIILSDRDKAIAQRDAMLNDLFTKVIPALTQNTAVLEQRQDIDRDLIDTIKSSTKQLESNTKAFEEMSYFLKHGGSNRAGGV